MDTLFQVHKGVDANGVDMSNVECDTVDEIESLLDRFDCDDMYARRQSKKEAQAEQVFEDLYKVMEDPRLCGVSTCACTFTIGYSCLYNMNLLFQKFNLFVKGLNDEKGVTRILTNIDDYLQESGTEFLVGKRMARADCYFLPIIQHVRVAGKVRVHTM